MLNLDVGEPKANVIARLNNVSKHYIVDGFSFLALDKVSCEIKRACMTFLFGPSGSGKTTLLNLLGLVDTPTSGEVELLGVNTNELSEAVKADFRNRHIGYVFQTFNLIPVLSVRENVEFPLIRHALSAKERKERAEMFLEAVGLKDFIDRRINQISGGQRQRVAIARALVTRPELVVADEPTANLDSGTSSEIMDLMSNMQKQFSTSFIICSHNHALIRPDSDVIHLKDGKIFVKESLA